MVAPSLACGRGGQRAFNAHQIPGARLLVHSGIVEWCVVNIPRQDAAHPTIIDKHDRVMLLSATAAEESRIQSGVRIVGVETLAIERDLPARQRI